MVGRRILSSEEVKRVLHRMGLEIMERHYGAELPFLMPASERGRPIAEYLLTVLDREGVKATMSLSPPSTRPVLLVDDVLYTGRTLLACIQELAAQHLPPQIEVLVLVDRGHRRYPIYPDYVGVRLATTLQEYVRVKTQPDGWEVWLE
ncbi:MAG: phosphoribosyltransferase family protein [Bacteroidia bacterium]|nr:phosphoribosyltransferase family protein [Bacteroidia bacterium]